VSRHSRRVSPGDRRFKFFEADGKCQRCGAPITLESFHLAHLRAASHGGPAVMGNVEAWCVPCNLKNGACDVRDTRMPLLDWQKEALPKILEPLSMQRVATLMAAPGAGKTLFSGATFCVGQDAGLWQRLLVLVPRLPLVNQWKRALLEDCHIALDTSAAARGSGHEYPKMDGICMTYQALLSASVRERHRDEVVNTPTLVVLDEVHHLGQPVNDENGGAAWANAVRELVGDLRTGINVAGVLNLSGTLFRTSPKERISTVQYINVSGERGEPRIQAIANFEIHADRLVREGRLRAPDLYRVGATVQIVDLKTAQITVSSMADLNDDAEARVALRSLNQVAEWKTQLVEVTLNQLELRCRDGRNAPVKALIVTHRQEMARAFAEEVNKQMASRRLNPLAECVVSDDGADAYRRLSEFRIKRRPGALCSVGMVGEGYDCPEIAVVMYATNVQTAQYIRQVVARGQRVTAWEREKVGHPLTTAIILPDIPDLVEQFRGILAPMVHDIEASPANANNPPSPDRPSGSSTTSPWSDKTLTAVHDPTLDVVSAVSTDGTFDADPALEELLTPMLRAVNLPESSWPRVAHVMDMVSQQRAFDPPILKQPASAAAVAERPAPVRRPLTSREHHEGLRERLASLRNWWAAVPNRQGGQPIAHFNREIHDHAGIRELDRATPEQLQRAIAYAVGRIRLYCTQTSTPLPKSFRDPADGNS
jgi:superfamily II DNA or RNA helicase